MDETRKPQPDGTLEQTVDGLIARAASAAADAAAATAAQMAAMADVVTLACRNRGLVVGSADLGRPGAIDLARRAAVAELAVSLHISENTVSAFVALATLLRTHLPHTWAALQAGGVSNGLCK